MTDRALLLVIVAAILGGDSMIIAIRRRIARVHFALIRFAMRFERHRRYDVQARNITVNGRQFFDMQFGVMARNEAHAMRLADTIIATYQSKHASIGAAIESRCVYVIPHES